MLQYARTFTIQTKEMVSVSDATTEVKDLSHLYSECTWAESAYYDAYEDLHDLAPGHPDIPEALRNAQLAYAHWVKVKEDYDLVAATDHQVQQVFQRPDGRILGVFSKMLPPQQDGLHRLTVDDLSDIKDLPKYWFLPLAVLALVAGLILGLVSLFDWSSISPLTILIGNNTVDATQGGVITTIDRIITGMMIVFMLLFALSWRGIYRWIQDRALFEEQWFRSGAEQWTTSQRIRSSVVFGACHIINIIYPIATLLVLMIGGATFMAVYLAEYRRSHDGRRSTLASARFHANYNAYALCLFGVGFIITVL